MELPTATVTVRFDKESVTGEQLAALVQQVVGQNGRGVSFGGSFVVEHRYYDGDIIGFGMTSSYPYNHIRVVPSLDGPPFFSPSETYSEVKVTSHLWGGGGFGVRVRLQPQPVINAVMEFADALARAYDTALSSGSFPEYVEPQNSSDDWR